MATAMAAPISMVSMPRSSHRRSSCASCVEVGDEAVGAQEPEGLELEARGDHSPAVRVDLRAVDDAARHAAVLEVAVGTRGQAAMFSPLMSSAFSDVPAEKFLVARQPMLRTLTRKAVPSASRAPWPGGSGCRP